MSITLAIQKSGRLNDESNNLLKKCGISIHNSRNTLKASAHNFPLELYNLRNSDIPMYVADGVADIGIVGENTLIEKQAKVDTVLPLGFGKCRLALAVPRDADYADISFFQDKSIATSYPVSLQKFLDDKGVKANTHIINGSVEIAPNIGLAEGICDLVESGNTLFVNGLKEVETILKSEAVLIKNPNLSQEKLEILDQLLFRINAYYAAKDSKYVVLNVPNEKIDQVCKLLPGMKSPSILPLQEEGWSALHSVIQEDQFWDVIHQLKQAGAKGILVTPIEKMIV